MSLVSFIIPAYNEERVLGRTLEALTRASRGLTERAEVIVVDDGSTDRTAEIARAHGARVVSVQHRKISATRNAGAREARGQWLVFVDADTLVTECLIRSTMTTLHSGAVGGGCAVRFDGRLPRYARALTAIFVPLYGALRLAAGCFLFCTRAAFEDVGGFDERLFAAEEVALSVALRRRGRFVILREHVMTSARKLRTHSWREVLGTLLRLAVRGPRAMREREALELWYGQRRADPESDS